MYFPLAEERIKWKMFSRALLGPGPEGLFWSHMLSVVCQLLFCCLPLLTYISELVSFIEVFIACTIVGFFGVVP